MLVGQFGSVQSDGIIKACDETVRIGNQVNRRTLMRHEPLSIHLEFILLRLPAKNRMVLQDQAGFIGPRLPLKEKRRRQLAREADRASVTNGAVVRAEPGVDPGFLRDVLRAMKAAM